MSLTKEELKKRFQRENYEVELFKEKGFIRKQCPTCNHHFWTLNADQETCGDTICSGGYKFLDKKGKNLSFDQTIKSLTDFFVKHGHSLVKDYPVVSRWRADMDFTIASIAAFQPWVLEGVIDPPANPLVIPQYCIRTGGEFSDIDNIGKTARHLTSFVMFGQHSFNSARLTGGYWKDKCIDLNFLYLTEELGLKPEEITYSEGIWTGGGNFGPNLEAMAYGTELVNNVFIAYGFENDVVKKLDMQVIDVGWGLDRVSWFTQGTPTIYEAIFPEVITYLQKESGYKADQELLIKYSKLAGLLAVEEVKNLKQARIGMAKKLGMSYEEMVNTLGPQEAMYAIGDHARTLSLTIADGAIPSNVGGGYNLRVLLRRILALKELFKLEFSLPKIFELQTKLLSVTYPRVGEHLDEILKIVDLEAKRYEDTKKSGRRLVNQLLSKNAQFNFDTLAELYQTRGINPLMVKEIAREYDVNIHVPEDFYIRIHEFQESEKASQKAKKVGDKDLEEDIDYITEPLYYEDVYASEFEAKIVHIVKGKYLILNKTLFYPTGGGQIHDTGLIRVNGKEYEVIDVFKKRASIIHELKEECNLKENTIIQGKINASRRMAIMRHHTAVHLVNNAARAVLGSHIWQAGADKTEEKARLDITHYKSISFDDLQKIEYLANQIILENRSIVKEELNRDKAEQTYGFSIYQGGVVPGKSLHLVIIKDWDIEACGGTHLDNTSDIGLIKLTSSERIQDGIVRLEILAGESAIKYIQQQEKLLKNSSSILSVEPKKLPQTVKRFFEEWKQQKKTIESLNKHIAELQFSTNKVDVEKIKDVDVILRNTSGGQKELIFQATEAVKTIPKGLSILVTHDEKKVIIVGAKSKGLKISLSDIVKKLSAMVGGSGGGNGDIAIGGGPKVEKAKDILKEAKRIIEETL